MAPVVVWAKLRVMITTAPAPLLLDGLMPSPDAATTVTVLVDADPATTYAAILDADFADMPRKDPLLRWVIAARALPDRLSRRLRGRPPAVPIAETGGRLGVMGEGPDAWIRLGAQPGREFAFGAIGQFLGAQVDWRPTTCAEFGAFAEPGYVKIAASLSVHPYGERRCLLTYDCRSTATDPASRASFLRYWRLVSPGIRIVLWRAAAMIRRGAGA
ncbi:hypothetical protein [Capillimicrobium parvum]|uniref:DUF2867 domain-containing protein n=1 Tax=Capillimicrobium parvum TaxID=2884022 RepID=A0A9E7C243_9ACTN|nr:hypothetical protein [Capillimicrobium parvum]UGS38071.1 hypothetical protein DSM104329_04493 [Capillimicrobium parvum]